MYIVQGMNGKIHKSIINLSFSTQKYSEGQLIRWQNNDTVDSLDVL